ncbi:pseudouridine synthase [Prolixibacteraceae bacterium Z1-6]|uniref:Pseudouridine synthase n=1 Tax=Draconibacterium aestuarii TaxID=2998507 RepID=A0A9X3F8L3_9BACT|nr:pseudouridine synthase [Prolixibacteraceae bacterium Z1-6]
MDIPILYQDEHLIVVDKPIDLPVHKNDFMPNDAPYLTKLVGDITGKWIYNVHRLDSKTSGVIVLALSSEIAKELTLQFERKEVQKTYFALVLGNPGEGTFDQKVLVKKKSKFKKPAVTHYKTIETVQTKISYKDKEDIEFSLVKITPETGRWHQLRQHFAKNKFDIIGDTHHGDFTLNKIILADTEVRRLFLHAAKLEFTHPVNKLKQEFESPLPEEFQNVLNHYKS